MESMNEAVSQLVLAYMDRYGVRPLDMWISCDRDELGHSWRVKVVTDDYADEIERLN